ncbi:hypothetical protein [Lacipirellula limnantheis]|uniref:hypothetical protein n=1 Tax=Lacipirellula limnantheis TaxID=2528024 RepID=UPI0011A4EE26|nr:hypothetical protein [Lacipirellula limnantheis]
MGSLFPNRQKGAHFHGSNDTLNPHFENFADAIRFPNPDDFDLADYDDEPTPAVASYRGNPNRPYGIVR